MEYDSLPLEIQQKAKNPFIFVSYCHENQDVYNRVQDLVSYLRKRNLPILYDEGGLKAGTELTQFENLILDSNCKYVLVVCDQGYLERINKNKGGAWREYFNISNDYPKHTQKYIPLVVDAELSIFQGKVYSKFRNSSKDELHKIEQSLAELKQKKSSKIKIEELIEEAKLLCDENNYNAADKKLTDAIEIYEQRSRTLKSVWATLYNLKLYICIWKQDEKNAIKFADKLQEVINDRLDYDKRTIYYANCALAYRIRDKESREYETCAKKAYQMAKKGGSNEMDYYACMYATALYEMEQWNKAYRIIKEAYKEFIKKYPNKAKYTKENNIMYIKIKGNIASISTECGINEKRNKNKSYSFLLEAKKSIMEILNMNLPEIDDAIYKEMYCIAEKVFSSLKKFYE